MIEQTVEVPVNHRLTIEVPREIPAGPIVIVFKSVDESSPGMTAQEAMDSGLGLGAGPRIDPATAIEQCGGIFKRLNIDFSSDDFLALRRNDKDLEERLDR